MNILLPTKPDFGLEPFVYWENFLTNEDILKILSLKEWHEKSDGMVGISNGDLLNSGVNKDIRKSQISWMNYTEETSAIWHKITNTISEVNSRFFHFDLTGCFEPAQLTLYDSKNEGHYNWHTDTSVRDRIVPRKLSMSLLLSDTSEFEGGDLELLNDSDKSLKLEQKKGRAWFFPSYMLHRVTPVTSGFRRSLVLWIGGPSFR